MKKAIVIVATLITTTLLMATVAFAGTTGTGTSVSNAFSSVTSDMITGLYDGIIGLLPTLLSPMIGFLGIKKGISFLFGMIRGV